MLRDSPWIIRNTAPRKPLKVFLQSGEHDLDNVHGRAHSWKHGGAIFPDTMRWLWSEGEAGGPSATREGPHPPEVEVLAAARL